jgi:hypothetical protein
VNYEAIGAAAELIAAVTVVVTLIYLAQQVRQSIRESKLAAIHDISKSYTDWLQSLSTDKELSAIFDKGMVNFEALEHEQRVRFMMTFSCSIRILDTAYSQHTAGRMDEEDWLIYDRLFDFIGGTSGLAGYFKVRGQLHSPRFTSFVLEKIKKSEATESSLYE